MCGGYSIYSDIKSIAKAFGATAEGVEIPSTVRTSPSDHLPVLTNTDQTKVQLAQWGLVTEYGGSRKLIINARRETLSERPLFRPLIDNRCLILADGFLEWQKVGTRSVPYVFRLKTHEPFAMAGLWTYDPQVRDKRFVLITTPAKSPVSEVHPRMPVVLGPQQKDAWLNTDQDEALSLLASASAEVTRERQLPVPRQLS